jgi:hypothetical protein
MRTNASASHWPAEAHGSAATRRVRNAWFADAPGAIEILARREVAAPPAPDRRMNARCTRPSDDEAPTPTDRDRSCVRSRPVDLAATTPRPHWAKHESEKHAEADDCSSSRPGAGAECADAPASRGDQHPRRELTGCSDRQARSSSFPRMPREASRSCASAARASSKRPAMRASKRPAATASRMVASARARSAPVRR